MISRILDITNCNHSVFLFGPRQVGKTTLLKRTLKPDLYINLLMQSEFLRYARDPSLLTKEVAALGLDHPLIVVDEIQRCPDLLNDIHLLIEEKNARFILTGSSARKLRRGGVNLLGGRAITYYLYPLVYEELGEPYPLDDVLTFGTLPKVALEKNKKEKGRLLNSYVENYLKEEIQQEALTRNVPAFARFLELAAFENGHLLNFSNLSREVGVHSKTIKEYFHILEDTLLGFYLYPHSKSHRETHVSHPKFYFFDRGIVSALRRELEVPLIPGSSPYGNAFEHWVILELNRLLHYRERQAVLSFFRTTSGAEVDLIIDWGKKIWAIEIKSSQSPRLSDLRGLKSFASDHPVERAICVCQTPRSYRSDKVEFLPWQTFLKEI